MENIQEIFNISPNDLWKTKVDLETRKNEQCFEKRFQEMDKTIIQPKQLNCECNENKTRNSINFDLEPLFEKSFPELSKNKIS